MPTLTLQLDSGLQDGHETFVGDPVWHPIDAALVIRNAPNQAKAFVQFACPLPPLATVTSANLRVRSGIAADPASLRLTALDWFDSTLTAETPNATVLDSLDIAVAAWQPGVWYELDVTALVQAIVNAPGWVSSGYATFGLAALTADIERQITAYEGGGSELAAALEVAYSETAETDPFSQVYAWLWGLLESNLDFAGLVPIGNRIRFDSTNPNPIKNETATADYPEVTIVPAGGPPSPVNTSASSSVVQRFTMSVSVGTLALGKYCPLKWAVYRAVAKWLATHKSLTWNDQPFVIKLTITAADELLRTADEARGTMEWFALWYVDVEMWFRTADL